MAPLLCPRCAVPVAVSLSVAGAPAVWRCPSCGLLLSVVPVAAP